MTGFIRLYQEIQLFNSCIDWALKSQEAEENKEALNFYIKDGFIKTFPHKDQEFYCLTLKGLKKLWIADSTVHYRTCYEKHKKLGCLDKDAPLPIPHDVNKT